MSLLQTDERQAARLKIGQDLWEKWRMNERVYRMKLKTIKKLLSAIKSRMEVMMGEAKNQY